MRLKSIEIQGFKSFADKTVLCFDKGITAVVGPNGSGKSNISDAVRWVLGEQSNKTLRGMKMEDVIFSGTATRKPLGYAEVTLVIDNINRQLECDSDEVLITRRYYRSGESEYRINNAGVRLKDIHELFMDTGLGRDGYSMIAQGKIDDIIGTKSSSERRDIFEEAAGISRYRYRKLEAERKLSAADDNFLRLKDILTELESRVGPLEEQSKKAEKFIEFSKEQEQLQIGVWLNSLAKYKDVLREQDNKITLARAQYEDINDKTAETDRTLERLAERSSQLIVSIDEARRASSDAEEQATRIDGDIAVKRNTIEHNCDTISRIEKEIDGLKAGDATTLAELELKKSQIELKNAEIEKVDAKFTEVQSELLNLVSESDSFSHKIDELNRELNILTASTAELKIGLTTATTSAEGIKARSNDIDLAIKEKTASVADCQKELDTLDDELKQCDETVEKCTNSINGCEMLLAKRREKFDTIKQNIDKLTLDESEKRRRAQIIEDLEKNMEGFAHSVKTVMNCSKRNELRGIHGTVYQLFKVDNKHAVAIEAALGNALQNIVVSSEEDAKTAINYLKATKGGRATFLPLTSVRPRHFKHGGVDKCDGYIGLASELISCDKKYEVVASSLLGEIVVAEDIDSAVSIARKYGYNFKIVTLDGQIVNSGGSMTGGSLSKNAGILSRSGEIEKLRNQADKIAAEIVAENERLKSAKEAIAALEGELLSSKDELTTANEDKIRVLGEIRRFSEQITAYNNDIAKLESENKQLNERAEALALSEKETNDKISENELKSNELNKQLISLTGGRDTTSKQREALSAKAADISAQSFTLKKEVELLSAAVLELNARINGQSAKADELMLEIDIITKQNANIEVIISDLADQSAKLRERSQQSIFSIESYNAERDEVEKQINELRQSERERLGDRERLSGELARLEERKSAMVRDYDDTIRKLYDEYGLTRTEAEAKGIVIDDISSANKRLSELKSKIKSLGSVNLSAIEEYKEVSERYEFLSAQLADVEKSRSELNKLINQLTGQMQTLFISRFDEINKHFSKVFAELFGGGNAELRLSDPDNVLESGIEIIVQPPGKNISIIEQLSGGEKALIAISIYFAIMKVNPPPFCILDEVDAALDDVNVTRFAAYLRRMTEATQYIVVTHRRGSMEEADMLYGVTMQEKGITKLLELNVSQIEQQMNLDR